MPENAPLVLVALSPAATAACGAPDAWRLVHGLHLCRSLAIKSASLEGQPMKAKVEQCKASKSGWHIFRPKGYEDATCKLCGKLLGNLRQ